jgi:hypothetical protein
MTKNSLVRRVVSSVALVALLTGAAACNGSAMSATVSGSATPATTPPAAAPGGAAPKGAATPEALMTTFVTDVLEQHYRKACLLNGAPPGTNLNPAVVCAQSQATKTLTSLRDGWVKPGITLPPRSKVTVNKITPKGDKATVTDTGISLDGHTLNALMMIGSHNAQGFGVTWTLQRQNRGWLIASMDLGN